MTGRVLKVTCPGNLKLKLTSQIGVNIKFDTVELTNTSFTNNYLVNYLVSDANKMSLLPIAQFQFHVILTRQNI